MNAALVFVVLALVFVTLPGLCFVLMGLELKRKGRPTQFISLSFNPATRIRVANEVFKEYRQLRQDENRVILLPRIIWTSLALAILCITLCFVFLAK